MDGQDTMRSSFGRNRKPWEARLCEDLNAQGVPGEREKKKEKQGLRELDELYCSHDITKAEATKKKKEDAPSSAHSREQEQTHRNSAPFAA